MHRLANILITLSMLMGLPCGGSVLCVGEGGHVAIEPGSNLSPQVVCSADDCHDAESSCGQTGRVLGNGGCGACTDIPLLSSLGHVPSQSRDTWQSVGKPVFLAVMPDALTFDWSAVRANVGPDTWQSQYSSLHSVVRLL